MNNFRKPGNLILVYWKDTLDSFFHASNIPFKYRIWAILHGFNPEAAWFKGINDDNKGNYLKDYIYYKHTPYNDPQYMGMVSKNRFRETLKDYPEYLPKYYAEIKNSKIVPREAWNLQIACHGADSILELLGEEKALALKRISGRAGEGFIVAKFLSNDQFTFNDVLFDRQGAKQYILSLDGYIISEYVRQCAPYERVWNKTSHTLRIQTCNVMTGKAEIIFSFLRFGSAKALHCVSHVVAPGIYTANIDVGTGAVKTVITRDEHAKAVHVTEHPDSGENMLFPVPHWDMVASKCLEMHDRELSNLAWLGWDIMITDDGFRILEINTLSGLVGVEATEPILASERLRPYFCRLIHGNKNRN